MKVTEKTSLNVIWSRGKKKARTHTKVLSTTLDKAIFDEKFQINTLIELDPFTNKPVIQKMSKFTVCLDKESGGLELAEVDFNMFDFNFKEYKMHKFLLNKCEGNDRIPIDP